MLPTFVIGLREGLEASLIVGIIAAFLGRNGRRDLMRWVLLGVGVAITLCAAGGIALYVVSADLPQKQQEGLETVIGVIAVAMVTYMVVWMKRHSRDLKKQLEGVAGTALAEGSAWALVGMAFLAVLREGFETAVFLVAAFNGATSRGAAGGGAVLGILLAIVLGYGIYRGGVTLNLSKFFRFTGFVLVLVAAGLVQTALRTAHEAGWLDWGQQATVDLSAVVSPGSVQSALITGMLGIQPQPRLIELVGWMLYLVPVGLYVAWPQGRGLARRTTAVVVAASAVAVGVVAGVLLLVAPARPGAGGTLTAAAVLEGASTSSPSGPVSVTVRGDRVTVTPVDVATGAVGDPTTLATTAAGTRVVDGVDSTVRQARFPDVTRTATLTYAELAQRNGGRLPLGVRSAGSTDAGAVPVTETTRSTVAVAVATASGRITDVTWTEQDRIVATGAAGPVVVPTTSLTAALDPAAAAGAVAAARTADDTVATRSSLRSAAALLGVLAGLLALVAVALFLRARRPRPDARVTSAAPIPTGGAPRRTATSTTTRSA